MANINVRKEAENRPAAIVPATAWEPFRTMRDLLNWDPFREIAPMMPMVAPAEFSPAFEVKETADGYMFRADVPGVKEADIEVTLTGNRLSIGGKREAEHEEKTDKYYTYERNYGDFRRTFTLPEGIDANAVNADLKNGVLTVSVKKTPQAQPKKIEVKSAASKS